MRYSFRLSIILLFAVAMAYCESAVVVYLRGWLLPDGAVWNLNAFPPDVMKTEIAREAATIVMLVTAAIVAGRNRWDRVGYFLIAFGIWDIFYYVWLKILIGWPESLFTPDVLFLIPKPWLGYVIEPCAVSALMVASGVAMTQRIDRGLPFETTWLSWLLTILGSIALYVVFTVYDYVDGVPVSPFGAGRQVIVWLALVSYLAALYVALKQSNTLANPQ